MRSKMAVANWKMNKDREEARQFARGLRSQGAGITGAEIVVCPPFTALDIMAQELSQSSVRWGGQNCFWEEKGAYNRRDLRGHAERQRLPICYIRAFRTPFDNGRE
jgi:triosephosphate isomerase